MKRLKMTTAEEVRRALTRISNMVLNNELDPKQANTIIYACNTVLSSIKTDISVKAVDIYSKQQPSETLADVFRQLADNNSVGLNDED